MSLKLWSQTPLGFYDQNYNSLTFDNTIYNPNYSAFNPYLTSNDSTEKKNTPNLVGSRVKISSIGSYEVKQRAKIARELRIQNSQLVRPQTEEESNAQAAQTTSNQDVSSIFFTADEDEEIITIPSRLTTMNSILSEIGASPKGPICTPQPEAVVPFFAYTNDERVQSMIDTLKRNATRCIRHGSSYNRKWCAPPKNTKPASVSTGFCYRYVKYGLMGGNLTSSYMGGAHAKDAGPHLERLGFENIRSVPPYQDLTSRDAPVGAILVYSGGKSGHIEVKTAENEYSSDFISNNPIDTYAQRRLIGIYVLPEQDL